MMDTNVSLQVIWTWISVISIRTKRAHVTGAVVNKAVTNHLVLAFEPFAALAARTTSDRAIVRSVRAVNVGVRAIERSASRSDSRMYLIETHLSRY